MLEDRHEWIVFRYRKIIYWKKQINYNLTRFFVPRLRFRFQCLKHALKDFMELADILKETIMTLFLSLDTVKIIPNILRSSNNGLSSTEFKSWIIDAVKLEYKYFFLFVSNNIFLCKK